MEFEIALLGTAIIIAAFIIGTFVFIYKIIKLIVNYKRDKNGLNRI